MADLDHLLHPEVADAAADAAEVPSFETIQRRGLARRRRRTAALLGATAVVVAAIGAGVVAWGPGRDGAEQLPPAGTPTRGGPLAPKAEPNRVVRPVVDDSEGDVLQVWADPADTTAGVVDIERLEVWNFGGGSAKDWAIRLADSYPGEAALDAADRVIEYGVVIDNDLDGVGDCEIGINNDNVTTTASGDFRVWVRNLRNGDVDERVGGPYGIPIDFVHPAEAGPDDPEPSTREHEMRFFFLDSTPTPCDGYGDSDNVYMWAQLSENGNVIERDVVPDGAWLHVE